MITLSNVGKSYDTRRGSRSVLCDINLKVGKSQKIGILGRNGAGKSTLVRILGGTERPTYGTVERSMSVSWPLAFSGGFQGSLTGFDNLRFICRVYGADIDTATRFVEDFSELGAYFREPVKTYSAGMRARLAFALSMAIEFDCYLIDEVLLVGDTRFHEKCHTELFEKRKDRALVLVSHMAEQIRAHCETFFVLHAGRIEQFDDVDEAYEYYEKNG
ncbi:MAG: ABC transporter ATP-binding protein [Candidatus Accumulibacter propinquus]|jgi:capsular polysaccharide transport system ATP-binding protein